jgi:hypothetical protein
MITLPLSTPTTNFRIGRVGHVEWNVSAARYDNEMLVWYRGSINADGAIEAGISGDIQRCLRRIRPDTNPPLRVDEQRIARALAVEQTTRAQHCHHGERAEQTLPEDPWTPRARGAAQELPVPSF